jgi:hypothetical protein
VACARIVGLDELREEPSSLQTAEQGEPDAGAGAPPTPEGASGAGTAAATGNGTGNGGGSAGVGTASGGAANTSANGGSADRLSPESDNPSSGTGGPDGGGATPVDSSAAAGSGGLPGCGMNADCLPAAACTAAVCQDGQCVVTGPAAPGTPCGSDVDGECTNPDTCDGQGICQSNDEVGTPCFGGTCAGGLCIALPPSGCAVDVVSVVPFTGSWSSVGRPDLYDGGCDSEGTPEYALVFTAPQSGTFRITSTGLVDGVPYTGPGAPGVPGGGPLDGDAVMTVANGNCAGGEAQQRACNDDAADGTLSSQVDLELAAGEVVTVYLNELQQTGGGTGTVSIGLLP